MESERTIFDWLQGPLLVLIVVTPLRFALEAGGLPWGITRFSSSTAFVFIMAAYLGVVMADHLRSPVRQLLVVGFALGYVNGFMTLIATVLSTYASIETHYRHHSLSINDAQHIFWEHVVHLPFVISVGACATVALVYWISQKVKRRLEMTHISS